ncbi:MAG: aminotransferase class V-fold PLP-dependent enzyme [Clostridia bacterium]|nr:aminotransferase class V-fold PLP-dependent enzyme [Clostridia bacterium]
MIYLDNAATTFPKPEIVYDTLDKSFRFEGANPGRSGHQLALKAGRNVYKTRERIADLFSIDSPMQIVLTHNTTSALNLAIKGVLFPKDHVILTSMEHNSVVRPIKELEKLGVENSIVWCNEKGEIELEDIKNEIKENTKLIVTTHASNITGTLFPIRQIGEIAREHNVLYLVDGAQTAGVFDINVKEMNIDLLAVAGHKGLLGPPGTGALYIRKGVNLKTLMEGGTGSESESIFQPAMMPDLHESGTANMPGLAGLGAGIQWIQDTGIGYIRQHEQQLLTVLLKGLQSIPKVKIYGMCDINKQAPVVSFNIWDKGSSQVAFELDRNYNIATRSGLHCAPLAHETIGTLKQGTVRLSLGYFNTTQEIEKTVHAISKIAST